MGLPMEVKSSPTDEDHVISHDAEQADVTMVTVDECGLL